MKIKNLILTISLILLITSIIWEFWPDTLINEQLSYENPIEMGFLFEDCKILERFWRGEWNLNYRPILDLNEDSDISLMYVPEVNGIQNEIAEKCELIIVTRLEIPGHIIEPGAQYITPYKNIESIRFNWNVQPSPENITGILWVYLNVNTVQDQEQKIPMFAIPVDIQKRAILSLSPQIIRMGLIIISLICMAFLVVVNKNRSQ